jgi:HD-like signal output (HDOD) protein
MDDPNSTGQDFSEIVGNDPNLAATVLKVVNSALFGFPGQIDSISRAVSLLGIEQLHDMVLGASAMKSLDLPNDFVPLKTFWRRSLFSGILAKLLASELYIRNSESLFVVGLLHEIGHLIIYSKYSAQATEAVASLNEENPWIHVAEEKLLGFHYGQVGGALMAQWQLPLNFQVITYYQPTPAAAPLHPIATSLLHLAHAYAHNTFDDTGLTLEQLIRPEASKLLNLTPYQIETALEKTKQASSEMEKALFG